MRGIDGTDAPFIVFAPHRFVQTESTQRRPARRHVDFGDTGIESIPIPPVWGWYPQAIDIRRRFPRPDSEAAFLAFARAGIVEPAWVLDQVDLITRHRRGAAAELEPAFVPLPRFVPWGFAPEPAALARHPLRPLPVVDEPFVPGIARASRGWETTDATLRRRAPRLAFVPPDVFLPRSVGWGFAPALPDLRPRAHRPLDRGYELVTSFAPVWTAGWEVQPVQPPRPDWNRASSMLRGIDGIDAPRIIPVFDGWEPTLFFPPHPRPERGAAVMIGDVWGAWGLFYYLIPSGAIAADSALYTAIAYDVGLPP